MNLTGALAVADRAGIQLNRHRGFAPRRPHSWVARPQRASLTVSCKDDGRRKRARSSKGKSFEGDRRRRGRPAHTRSPYDSPLRDGNRDRLMGYLTERSAKTLACYLYETNLNVFYWLTKYLEGNPIPRNGSWDDVSGDTFLRKLLSMQVEEARYNNGRDPMYDCVTGIVVDPRVIARRIMDIRTELAKEFIQDLQNIADENSLLLRETLHESFNTEFNDTRPPLEPKPAAAGEQNGDGTASKKEQPVHPEMKGSEEAAGMTLSEMAGDGLPKLLKTSLEEQQQAVAAQVRQPGQQEAASTPAGPEAEEPERPPEAEPAEEPERPPEAEPAEASAAPADADAAQQQAEVGVGEEEDEPSQEAVENAEQAEPPEEAVTEPKQVEIHAEQVEDRADGVEAAAAAAEGQKTAELGGAVAAGQEESTEAGPVAAVGNEASGAADLEQEGGPVGQADGRGGETGLEAGEASTTKAAQPEAPAPLAAAAAVAFAWPTPGLLGLPHPCWMPLPLLGTTRTADSAAAERTRVAAQSWDYGVQDYSAPRPYGVPDYGLPPYGPGNSH